LAACAKSGEEAGGSEKAVELTVDIFGDQGFGYEDLYAEYQREHPNVHIVERGKGRGLGDYNKRLTQWMDSGAGAGDIVALEEGTIVQFKAQADRFVNLLDHGAGSAKDEYIDWKWQQGMTADGKQLIGLGTDVGSMAICYRKDLFAKAGLPTDRDQVSALWPDWNGFIAAGQRFAAAKTNAKFVDAATNVFNTIMMQVAGAGSGHTYFDTSDKLVVTTNPDVKTAWDLTVRMISAGLSANLRSFSDGWNAGFKQAQFATIGCPAWMTGVIKGQAGEAAAGKWDIAKAPGNGGNWGGSFLAVPKQSAHQKEATELALYLTNAAAQVEAFKKLGNLPSNVKALDDPAVKDAKNDYFSDAPTGQLFGASAKSLEPVYLGAKNQAVRDAVENALRTVEQAQRTSDQAWQVAGVEAAKAAST
jgi:cellobiose transport system substrate-binding protein